MYDLSHTSNGGLIKDFKDSNSSRKSVGPKSFGDLFSAEKWKEWWNGK